MKTKIINYADYKYSYVHALEPKLKKLNYLANVQKKPAPYMAKVVFNMMNEAGVRYTEKEINFSNEIKSCYDGTQIYYRVKNAVKYTRENVFVRVDENGELVD